MRDRRPKRRFGFVALAQLAEENPAMDVRLDVARIESEGPLELGEGPLALTQQGERKPEQMVGVCKAAPRSEQLFQEVDRAVIVLHRKALARLGKQMIRADLHPLKITAVSA